MTDREKEIIAKLQELITAVEELEQMWIDAVAKLPKPDAL